MHRIRSASSADMCRGVGRYGSGDDKGRAGGGCEVEREYARDRWVGICWRWSEVRATDWDGGWRNHVL